jgi:pimeloyl-ACP methyl ester carboxylesterase
MYHFSLLLSLCLLTAFAPLSAQRTHEGEIDGATYVIEVPAEPTGRVLLLAHGYRPEGLPLSADIGSSTDLYQTLLAEGWIVASTSYRRNGWIFEDAAADIINLRDYIQDTITDPTHVYLMGNSMGGGIITWLAEHAPEGFDGGLAMGAYLFGPIVSEGESSKEFNATLSGIPAFPILYLTNTSELEGPVGYIELAKNSSMTPVLRKIQRSGHVNQNKAEQAAGLAALVTWVEEGMIDREKDGTILGTPTSTAEIANGRGTSIAQILVPVYGNFISNFIAEDMATLQIAPGDQFHLQVNDQTVSVLMGSNYTDVPVGEWVAFWEAEGYLLFCRNYKNAVETLGIEPKATIKIWK